MVRKKRGYYEGRIEAMTSLLNKLSPQVARSSETQYSSADADAYYHIATLLTRGSEDFGHGRKVVAVTGVKHISESDITALERRKNKMPLTTSPGLGPALSRVHIAVAQNQSVDTPSEYGFTRIIANPLPLKEIMATLTTKGIPLAQHAADLLAALNSTSHLHRSLDGGAYGQASYVALSLIVQRCYPKIQRRIQGFRYLFDDTTLSEIGRLEIEKLGDVGEHKAFVRSDAGCTWVYVGQWVEEDFSANNVPCQRYDNLNYFLFDAGSANLWVRTLVSLFNVLVARTKNQPKTRLQWDGVQASLSQLHAVAYTLRPFFAAIFKAPRFVRFLNEHLQVNYTPGGFCDSGRVDEQIDEDERSDILSDVGLEEGESPGRILLRYLQVVSAWNQAYAWLDNSKVFRAHKDVLTLNIISTRIPPYSREDKIPSTGVVLEEFLKRLKVDEATQTRVQKDLANAKKFKGTIHCEAILMALIGESIKNQAKLPPGLVEILKDANHIMAVAKKCCWACALLATLMEKHDGQYFTLPGTSGMIFPWAPPPGLSTQILREIESQLQPLLLQSLKRHILRTVEGARSHQSSPALSATQPSYQEANIKIPTGLNIWA